MRNGIFYTVFENSLKSVLFYDSYGKTEVPCFQSDFEILFLIFGFQLFFVSVRSELRSGFP